MESLSVKENAESISKLPVILALEASGDLLSAALWVDGSAQYHEFYAARHGHAARIATLVDRLMKTANVTYAQITHVAAGRGPGSFTGIRVALAAAKGFCLATGAAGLGVNCLAALAAHHGGSTPVLVSAETRRGPCYTQLFDSDGVALTSTFEMTPDEIACVLPPGLFELSIVGWRSDELAASVTAAGNGITIKVVDTVSRVDASHIAAYAAALINASDAGEELTPLYLAPALLGLKRQAGK